MGQLNFIAHFIGLFHVYVSSVDLLSVILLCVARTAKVSVISIHC